MEPGQPGRAEEQQNRRVGEPRQGTPLSLSLPRESRAAPVRLHLPKAQGQNFFRLAGFAEV